MTEQPRKHGSGTSPLRRAHASLWILIGIAILAAGGLTSTVMAPPSPIVGFGFGVSALLLAASLVLAGRVTIALERARRNSRPVIPDNDSLPILRKLLRIAPGASQKKK
ncbi:hypothetical protein [Cryobacterium psychrophilum]|uniref:Uncharacterized protein n=1 Tax=Cryobacterium psychrophilum TaxID=41988 RepID=A0A4Y8KRJ2_9MICO|nr:hypothetical protein [Cryobacterium psychrophilum]TDW28886.1 hypothetical protein EDD25_0545 [Cryobacterium psychrophilum]TFD81078.1 hypothetical protein E3T53_03625 [Cryobacterium psychrophilum]